MLRRTNQNPGSSLGNLSWRYSPEGNTDDDPNAAANKAIKDGEAEFNKEQQKKDQDAANERKYQAAETRAQAAEQQSVNLRAENEAAKEKLIELEAQAKQAGIQNVDLKVENYSDADVPLVKAILAGREERTLIQERLDKADERENVRKKADEESAARGQRTQVFNELLTELDGDYGAQNRNAAIKEWDEKVAAGEIPKNNPARATRIMEKCYKNAKAAADKAAKESGTVTLDSGHGGGSPGPGLNKVKLKSGSLEEVAAQLVGSNRTPDD